MRQRRSPSDSERAEGELVKKEPLLSISWGTEAGKFNEKGRLAEDDVTSVGVLNDSIDG